MKSLAASIVLAAFAGMACAATAPADAPAGSKGLCKDGSYSTSAEKKGACRGHKGVKDWYGEEATAAPMRKVGTTAVAPTAPTTATTAPASTPGPVSTAKPARPAALPAQAAPGGGAGQVWANESTKVYHCSGDRYYGKTKTGAYMSEGDAKSKGFRASDGKACG